MATITLRSVKGSPLTNTEVDNNFTNLNDDKLENIVADDTPQLGGNLDAQTFNITGSGQMEFGAAQENKISFLYSALGDLPSATTWHGMFAHVHGEASSYYAHSGSWVKLLDENKIGTDVLAHDANLQSFVSAFTLPTSDGTDGQVLTTDGNGNLQLETPAAGGINTGKAIAMAIVFGG